MRSVLDLLLLSCVHRHLVRKSLTDSSDVPAKDSFFLLKKKGWLGKLAKSISTDTSHDDNLVRLDYLYRHYSGRVITQYRNQTDLDFGVPINDTSPQFQK